MLRPMLAAKKPEEKHFRFPCIVQPKYDGIRALVGPDGYLHSRNLKQIPNRYIQSHIKIWDPVVRGLDGELTVGNPTDADCYRKSDSGVMSAGGEPDFTYNVYDITTELNMPYEIRREALEYIISGLPTARIQFVPQTIVKNISELYDEEERLVSLGWEGAIVRHYGTPYKQGRSTLNQGYLIALKRFEDCEGEVYGFQELLSNQNEATINELGYTERSSHKANKVPMDTLGALLVRTDGVEHKIGTGFSAADRKWIWCNQHLFLGKIAKYKKQATGGYDKPRIPVFLGWRSDI